MRRDRSSRPGLLGGEFLRATVGREPTIGTVSPTEPSSECSNLDETGDPHGELARLWVPGTPSTSRHGGRLTTRQHVESPAPMGPAKTAGLITDVSQRAALPVRVRVIVERRPVGVPTRSRCRARSTSLSGDVRELHATDVKGNKLADVVEQRNGFSCSIVSDAATGQAFDQLISVQCPSPLTVGPSAMPAPWHRCRASFRFFGWGIRDCLMRQQGLGIGVPSAPPPGGGRGSGLSRSRSRAARPNRPDGGRRLVRRDIRDCGSRSGRRRPTARFDCRGWETRPRP
jgi:hypothetical protein